jgi:hypothetical protein
MNPGGIPGSMGPGQMAMSAGMQTPGMMNGQPFNGDGKRGYFIVWIICVRCLVTIFVM